MAKEKVKNLDVWIVESNNVYRGVPYTVVIDWIQQGRLLEDDRVRAAGKDDWHRIGAVRSLAAFLPKEESQRVEDQAEALEPVHAEFGWKNRHDEDEGDVDMIPLIDISLVLLIFFMMTSTVGGGKGSVIPLPSAQYRLLAVDPEMVWIGIRPDGAVEKGKPVHAVYSIGKGDATRADNLTKGAVLQELNALLSEKDARFRVIVKADQALPISVVNDMTAELENYKRTNKIAFIYAGVSEK